MLPLHRAIRRVERRLHRDAVLHRLWDIGPAAVYAGCLDFAIRSGSQKAQGYASHLFREIFGTWPRPQDRGEPKPLPDLLIEEWAAMRKRKVPSKAVTNGRPSFEKTTEFMRPTTACTSGRRSRDKGNRTERALVAFLQGHGFAAERVPLSGAARGRFGGDVSIPLLGVDRRCEVKCRANRSRELYAWLDGADFLVVKADRLEPLVILPLKLAAEIAGTAEKAKCESLAIGSSL